MIDIQEDGAVCRNTAAETGAPAARIRGDKVRFTNADSGRPVATLNPGTALTRADFLIYG